MPPPRPFGHAATGGASGGFSPGGRQPASRMPTWARRPGLVHEGCPQSVRTIPEPRTVLKEDDGAPVTVPSAFDAQRIRLTVTSPGTALPRHPPSIMAWVTGPVPLSRRSPTPSTRGCWRRLKSSFPSLPCPNTPLASIWAPPNCAVSTFPWPRAQGRAGSRPCCRSRN